MPLLIDAEVVEIVVVPSAGIHTREGFDPEAALVAHLEHYGVKARLHILEGRDAGRTVLDFAVRSDADLIVMGAYGQYKLHETILGGATRFLLRHSKITIVWRCEEGRG